MGIERATAPIRVLHLARIGAIDADRFLADIRIHGSGDLATFHTHPCCARLAGPTRPARSLDALERAVHAAGIARVCDVCGLSSTARTPATPANVDDPRLAPFASFAGATEVISWSARLAAVQSGKWPVGVRNQLAREGARLLLAAERQELPEIPEGNEALSRLRATVQRQQAHIEEPLLGPVKRIRGRVRAKASEWVWVAFGGPVLGDAPGRACVPLLTALGDAGRAPVRIRVGDPGAWAARIREAWFTRLDQARTAPPGVWATLLTRASLTDVDLLDAVRILGALPGTSPHPRTPPVRVRELTELAQALTVART